MMQSGTGFGQFQASGSNFNQSAMTSQYDFSHVKQNPTQGRGPTSHKPLGTAMGTKTEFRPMTSNRPVGAKTNATDE